MVEVQAPDRNAVIVQDDPSSASLLVGEVQGLKRELLVQEGILLTCTPRKGGKFIASVLFVEGAQEGAVAVALGPKAQEWTSFRDLVRKWVQRAACAFHPAVTLAGCASITRAQGIE